MKTYVVAGTVAAIAILGLSTVNINHHLNIPPEVKNPHQTYTTHFVDLNFPFVHTAYNIQMADEIKGTDTVRNIDRILQTANKGDTVTFHLSGYGGQVETVNNIINNIRASKAYVTMSVEAPVYSGHAFLAVNGNAIKVGDQSFLMFHTSTMYNVDCKKETGVDRGMTNIEHCDVLKENHILLVNKMIFDSSVLTFSEKVAIASGKDVYLQGEEVNKRLNK